MLSAASCAGPDAVFWWVSSCVACARITGAVGR